MGLDMFLLKVSKIDASDLTKKNVDDLKCDCFLKNKSSTKAIKEVMPWVTEKTMLVSRPDEKLIRKAFNIPDNMDFVALCDGPYEHIYTYGTEDCSTTMEARFPLEEIGKYCSEKEEDVYLFKQEILDCWHKDYELSGAIITAFDKPIEDGKMYPVTDRVRNVLRGKGLCYEELEADSQDYIICYEQWR